MAWEKHPYTWTCICLIYIRIEFFGSPLHHYNANSSERIVITKICKVTAKYTRSSSNRSIVAVTGNSHPPSRQTIDQLRPIYNDCLSKDEAASQTTTSSTFSLSSRVAVIYREENVAGRHDRRRMVHSFVYRMLSDGFSTNSCHRKRGRKFKECTNYSFETCVWYRLSDITMNTLGFYLACKDHIMKWAHSFSLCILICMKAMSRHQFIIAYYMHRRTVRL